MKKKSWGKENWMSDNRHRYTHCLWTFLISEGQLIMKAFGVGRSKGKPTAGPALQPLSLCLLNGPACWGTRVAATKIANRSFRKKRAKDFFMCACPCIILFSLWNHPYTKHKDNFFFFLEEPQGRLQSETASQWCVKKDGLFTKSFHRGKTDKHKELRLFLLH